MAEQDEETAYPPADSPNPADPSETSHATPLATNNISSATSNIIPRHQWKTATHDERLCTNLAWHRIYIAMRKACNKRIKTSQERVTDSVAQKTVDELEKDVKKLKILIEKTTALQAMVEDETKNGWEKEEELNKQWTCMEELWVVHKSLKHTPDFLKVDILASALGVEGKFLSVHEFRTLSIADDEKE